MRDFYSKVDMNNNFWSINSENLNFFKFFSGLYQLEESFQ